MIDFLGIGAQKAGTTWLSRNLSQHPDVWTPFIKELHYFDVVHLDSSATSQLDIFNGKISRIKETTELDPVTQRYFDKVIDSARCFTDDWYRHVFSVSPTQKIKGEITPYYSSLNAAGIEHVKRLAPNIRLIYFIRDPVDRAKSSLRMNIDRGIRGTQLELVSSKAFQSRGDYCQNIPRWEATFGRKQLLYIPFGMIKKQPEAVIRQVEKFLGLTPFSAYSLLDSQVFPTRRIMIDRDASELITKISAVQYAYLLERFDAEFLELIK